MLKFVAPSALCFLFAFSMTTAPSMAQAPAAAAAAAQPKRINRAIEQLEQGQPVYYTQATGGYEVGRKFTSRATP